MSEMKKTSSLGITKPVKTSHDCSVRFNSAYDCTCTGDGTRNELCICAQIVLTQRTEMSDSWAGYDAAYEAKNSVRVGLTSN